MSSCVDPLGSDQFGGERGAQSLVKRLGLVLPLFARYCRGLKKYQYDALCIPNMSAVSDTSNRPQKDIGNCFGLCTRDLVCFGLLHVPKGSKYHSSTYMGRKLIW